MKLSDRFSKNQAGCKLDSNRVKKFKKLKRIMSMKPTFKFEFIDRSSI